MQNFPNSATLQKKLNNNNSCQDAFAKFQSEESRLSAQCMVEEDADNPCSDAASVEFEVLYDDDDDDDGNELASSTIPEAADPTPKLPTNAEPAQWTRRAIYHLIGLYKHLALSESLGRSSFGPTAIWTEVSKKLLKRGYICTPEQCRTKWLLLKKLYLHISNESQAKKFDFLEAMHDYIKHPRIEKLLQKMKNKSVKQPAVHRKSMKRKRGEEADDDVVFYLAEDSSEMAYEKIPLSCATSNNELESNITDDYGIFKEMEEHLVDQNTSNSEMMENKCEEEYIVIERQEEPTTLTQRYLINKVAQIPSTSKPIAFAPHNISDENTSHETLESYLQQIKDLIELQEKRRDDRHNAKLQMFCEYNERLLAQQEKAIMLHKSIMERLIDSL